MRNLSGLVLWISEMVKQWSMLHLWHTQSWDRRWDWKDFWFNSLGCYIIFASTYNTHTHTETDGHFYIDAGVRVMTLGYYPLCEVAQYLLDWDKVLEAQPANCMETMQHVGDIFSRSRSIASLRGLRLNAGWWTESSIPGPHEWGHLVNFDYWALNRFHFMQCHRCHQSSRSLRVDGVGLDHIRHDDFEDAQSPRLHVITMSCTKSTLK